VLIVLSANLSKATTMKAIDVPFTKIVNGTTQFVIPVFQRDYSWTEAQCEQLWNDIIFVAGDSSDRGHFLGSIVYVSTGDTSAGFTRWLLIDGQQRVTTLTLLLLALRDHIFESGWSGNENDPTPKRIDAYFLKNMQEEGNREHKLVLRRHDQATLHAIIDQRELPENASVRVKENYDYFRERLLGVDPSSIYLGIGRLLVVDVTLDRNIDDPQQIFESLNSTGVDLSQSDLIRNFILMRLPEKEQTHLYEQYWSRIETLFRGSENTFDAFARDYVALHTRASKQAKASDIYQSFRYAFDGLQQQFEGVEETLEDMLRFARFHAAFSLGVGATKALARPLAHVRRLVDVPAVLVMRLFNCHDRLGTLTEPEFVESLGLIESYIFRRNICGEQTRGYWQVFANLAYKIDEDAPLESLKVALARLRENYRYPSSEEFHLALQQRDLYGLRVCAFLLDRLENYDTREPTDTSGYSIEHILPQNDKLLPEWRDMLGENWQEKHRTWLHRLGNLTLTGYNSTYSDRGFEEKKSISGGFSESSIRLNKFVREQPVWTPVEIERRGSELARLSLKVWPELVVDQNLIHLAEQNERRELAARRDVEKVRMSDTARTLFDQLRRRVIALGEDVLELAETQSVSYHGPDFFLEVLPRKHRLSLLLPLDFHEIDDPSGIAEDATQWKFLFYANYEGGVSLRIQNRDDIDAAMPIIHRALEVACA
jgi:predicted transport protein